MLDLLLTSTRRAIVTQLKVGLCGGVEQDVIARNSKGFAGEESRKARVFLKVLHCHVYVRADGTDRRALVSAVQLEQPLNSPNYDPLISSERAMNASTRCLR